MPIYSNDMASEILDLFEGLLSEHDIEIPVPECEKKEREETEDAGHLFGTLYYELLSASEKIIKKYLRQAGVDFVPDIPSGRI